MTEEKQIGNRDQKILDDVLKNRLILTDTLRKMNWDNEAVAIALEETCAVMLGITILRKKNIKIMCEHMQANAEKIWSKHNGKKHVHE